MSDLKLVVHFTSAQRTVLWKDWPRFSVCSFVWVLSWLYGLGSYSFLSFGSAAVRSPQWSLWCPRSSGESPLVLFIPDVSYVTSQVPPEEVQWESTAVDTLRYGDSPRTGSPAGALSQLPTSPCFSLVLHWLPDAHCSHFTAQRPEYVLHPRWLPHNWQLFPERCVTNNR